MESPLTGTVPQDTFYYKSFKTRKSTAQCMREYADWLDDEEDEEMMTTASCLDWTVKRLESARLKEQDLCSRRGWLSRSGM